MKKNGFLIKILLGFMLGYSVVWWLVMCVIAGGISCAVSGEVWLQLISSWLLAIPSIGICAYALIQTKKYHDLDEERLRPELLMESAEVLMYMVNWAGFDDWAHSKDSIGVRQLEIFKQYRQEHSGKQLNGEKAKINYDNLGFLDFKADLVLKGGESVSHITVQQITVLIGNRQYFIKFTDKVKTGVPISFKRSYKNGQEKYRIEWRPDFKDILPEESEHIQEEFWDDMYNAIGDPEYNSTRRDMEWRISMGIEYGLNKSQNQKMPVSADWKIWWNEEETRAINEYTKERLSQEGMISIC